MMHSLTTASRTVKQFARPHARCRTIVAGGGAETCSVSPAALFERFQQTKGLVHAAHLAWTQAIRKGDTVVDATLGNGHDTLFLARAVGPSGSVYGFDIQEQAVQATRQRLDAELLVSEKPQVHLACGCHSQLLQVLPAQAANVSLVCFNLGYLPSGDKALITRSETTLAALDGALQVVRPGGLVSILAYIGHAGGNEEYQAVAQRLAQLPHRDWCSTESRLLNASGAPVLLLAWRAV